MNKYRKNFTQTIWNRGKEYYLGNYVEMITYDENYYQAEVEGNYVYEVEVWTDGDEITGFSCSCPASMHGEKLCKHIAAVCMEISDMENTLSSMERLTKNHSMKDIFQYYTNDNNEVYNGKEDEVFEVAYERITSDFQKVSDYIYELYDGIIQYRMLEIDTMVSRTFLNYCYEQLKTLYMKDKQSKVYVSVAFTYFIDQATRNDVIEFLENVWGVAYSMKDYVDILDKLLDHQEVFLVCVITLKRNDNESIQCMYEQLKQYAHMQVVKELYFLMLLEQDDTKQAKHVFEKLQKETNQFLLLSEKDMQQYAIQLKNKTYYRQEVENYLKGWRSAQDIDYVTTYRSMFTEEEWEQEKDEILQSWLRLVNKDRYIEILKVLKEYDYIFLLALELKDVYILWENFSLLQSFDEERLASLILLLMEHLIEGATSRHQYRLCVEMIANFQIFTYKDKMQEEFLYFLKNKYADKTTLMEELQYLETGGVEK